MSTTSSPEGGGTARRKREPPVKKIGPLASGVAVCVWANQTSGEAAPRTFHTVTISPRRYLDRDTNLWKDAGSFHPSDLPGLIYALEVALKFCFETDPPDGDVTMEIPVGEEIPF